MDRKTGRKWQPQKALMTHEPAAPPETMQKRIPDSGAAPPRKRKPKREPWIMEREECAIVKSLPNTGCTTGLRNRAMLELMHRAGLRVGEVCGLLTRDIIGLEEGAQRGAARVIGKGDKERTVSLDAQTIHWMRRWNDVRRGRRFPGRTFFCTFNGKPVLTRYVQDLVRRMATKAAELGMIAPERALKITPHKFRHAFATENAEEGTDLVKIQAQLGHANVATTSIYAHAREGAMADVLARRPPDLPVDP